MDRHLLSIRCVSAVAPSFLDLRSAPTFMASPHVAGVAAIWKSEHGDASQGTINSWLNSRATNGVIIGNPSNTPNRLLFLEQSVMIANINFPGVQGPAAHCWLKSSVPPSNVDRNTISGLKGLDFF